MLRNNEVERNAIETRRFDSSNISIEGMEINNSRDGLRKFLVWDDQSAKVLYYKHRLVPTYVGILKKGKVRVNFNFSF